MVAEELRITSPSSFWPCQVKSRNGTTKFFGAFTSLKVLEELGWAMPTLLKAI